MRLILLIAAAAAVFLSSGCASIVSKSSYPILITAKPENAEITIKNRVNQVIYSGAAPATVDLDAGDGFFKKATYILEVSAPGFGTQTTTINHKLDGWYFGNLLFGGIIGMLIIDPITGAMFKPTRELYSVVLARSTSQFDQQPRLHLMDINDVPEKYRSKLERVAR